MSHNIWITSDTHFGHKNVIKYSGRPWETVEDMNEGLIKRWNECVKKGDTVYHLGDFCLTVKVNLIDEWLSRLNGTIRLIRGNHDQWTKHYERLKHKNKIEWVKDYVERRFTLNGEKHHFVMCHFPMLSWHGSHKSPSSIMLHGHCHGSIDELNQSVRRLDVGVDCHNWYPVHLESIVSITKTRSGVDHHA